MTSGADSQAARVCGVVPRTDEINRYKMESSYLTARRTGQGPVPTKLQLLRPPSVGFADSSPEGGAKGRVHFINCYGVAFDATHPGGLRVRP